MELSSAMKYTIKKIHENNAETLKPKVDAFKSLVNTTKSDLKRDLNTDDKTAIDLTKIALGASKDDTNEDVTPTSPVSVTFISKKRGEEPFNVKGKKFQFVNGLYPNNEVKVAVYSYDDDQTYDRDWFRQNIAMESSVVESRIIKVSDIRKK